MKNSQLPLVSIAIITYNQIDFIHEAILSALNQDYENLEVVVADDGSVDGTATVIKEYAEKFPDRLVPVIGRSNIGITANSNRALKKCRGEFIALQGGDDILLPGKIAAQVKWFSKSKERVLCGHQIEVFYMDGFPTHLHKRKMRSGRGPKWLIRNGVPFGATSIMLRTSAIPAHGFEPRLPNVSDHHLYIEILANGSVYGYVDGIYARYRKHANNITHQKEKMIREIQNSLYIIAEQYPEFKKDCNYAKWSLVQYGYGITKFYRGDYVNAFCIFFNIAMRIPFCYKVWFRLVQSMYYLLKDTVNFRPF